jgi:valyl-tRNA synthetase
VTEELWGHIKQAASDISPEFAPQGGWEAALIVARWPEPRPEEAWESGKSADFGLVQDIVRAIRNLRSEKNVQPARRIPAMLAAGDSLSILQDQAATLAALAQLDPDQLKIAAALDEKPDGHIALVVGQVEVYLPLAGLVDPGEELSRLQKDLGEARSQIERLEKLLASPFAQKAPEAVVEKERAKLAAYLETAEKLAAQLEALE